MKELKSNYKKYWKDIRQRLKEFEKVTHPNMFYELCFCLTTPQSNAKKCNEAVCLLAGKDLLNSKVHLQEMHQILQPRTRFFRNKSRYILLMKRDYESIKCIVAGKNISPEEIREELVLRVKGMGMKESSHFLRNIGFKNLAILDRHILRNLVKYKVIPELPGSLNKKNYLEIEKKFQSFAKKVKIPMDELDLLFWAAETGEVFK